MPYWFDGNNLIGQSTAAAKSDLQTRRAFLSTLASYHQSGGGKFLVYFDGDDPERSASPPGVAVRYSAPLSTDEVILQRLRDLRHASEVIVVTNDRELTARCRHEGASVLTWPEFTTKMKSRRSLQSARTDSQKNVDVDDWMRYFGFENLEKPGSRGKPE
jgi:predicted RNA-binding protein with PIN domain